jgi:hypothetical protein
VCSSRHPYNFLGSPKKKEDSRIYCTRCWFDSRLAPFEGQLFSGASSSGLSANFSPFCIHRSSRRGRFPYMWDSLERREKVAAEQASTAQRGEPSVSGRFIRIRNPVRARPAWLTGRRSAEEEAMDPRWNLDRKPSAVERTVGILAALILFGVSLAGFCFSNRAEGVKP